MTIRCKTSRLANKFHFISTLAAWHYSCRRDDREKWLQLTGELTEIEENALRVFSALMREKYGFQAPETYLGEIFYKCTDRTAWPALKKLVKNYQDYDDLKNVFSVFENRFKKIWDAADRSGLSILKKEFGKKNTNAFFETVVSLFGDENTKKTEVTLIILFSPFGGEKTAAGSANLKGRFVTLELPVLKSDTWQLFYSIALTGHEIGHMYFAQRDGRKLIDAVLKDLRLKEKYDALPFPTASVLNEAITSAFVPLGILGKIFFADDLTPLMAQNIARANAAEESLHSGKSVNYYGQLEFVFTKNLQSFSEKYVKQGKKIDKKFITEAGRILMNLLEK